MHKRNRTTFSDTPLNLYLVTQVNATYSELWPSANINNDLSAYFTVIFLFQMMDKNTPPDIDILESDKQCIFCCRVLL